MISGNGFNLCRHSYRFPPTRSLKWNLGIRHATYRRLARHGRSAPGFLKEGVRSEPRVLVQQQIIRLEEQLNDPTARTPWKSYPEVKQGVEGVVAKLAATRRYGPKFGLHQQQGPADPNNSTTATAEKAQTIPAQLATEQQHQQQGAVEPKKPTLATVEMLRAHPAQPATAQKRKLQGSEKPDKSFILRIAIRSYETAAEGISASVVAR